MARPANISKNQIIKAAKDLFIKNGIHSTEMNDIAGICGIGRSSLYRYFNSRESIALAIADDVLIRLCNKTNEGLQSEGNGYEKISTALTSLLDYMKANLAEIWFINCFDQYFSDALHEYEGELNYVSHVKHSRDMMTLALREGIGDGSIHSLTDPEFTSGLIINTLLALGQRVLPRKRILRKEQGFAEEYLDELLQLLLKSIVA